MEDVRVGDRVAVRRQRWIVTDVCDFGTCRLLTLAGADAASAGTGRRVLVPFDIVDPGRPGRRLQVVRPSTWRRTLRTLLAGSGTASALRTAARAQIALMPHQLEPAMAVVAGLGSRLLLADEVGLGKTIQAALIIAELHARGAVDRVLVLTPAGLRDQWAAELADRFGLTASIADPQALRRRSSILAVGVNPWTTMPLVIASVDYVKRPEVLPAVRAARWDIVVVDEAHGAPPGTDRHEAVAALCGTAAYVVLLTATPHNGDRHAFSSLCGLGARDGDKLMLFRRRRDDIVVARPRHIHRLYVRASEAESRMHRLLGAFARTVRRQDLGRRQDVRLTLTMLQKRALSSAHSLDTSVRRRLSCLAGNLEADETRQLALPLDEAGEVDGDDAPPAWAETMLRDAERERQLLVALAEAARDASKAEAKLLRLARLLAWLDRLGEPAIVFTEYRDTLLHVRRTLGRDAAILHGGLSRDERRAAVADFVGGRRALLLATDAAGEGLNLQGPCRTVINLELPWNPWRLEQRIGRVDRIGQQRTVHAFHLIARDGGETSLLDRLKARVALARMEIGASDPLDLLGDEEEPVATSDGQTDGESSASGWIAVRTKAAESAREHARLTWVRCVLEGHSRTRRRIESSAATDASGIDVRAPRREPLEAGGPVQIGVARRGGLRAALGGRVLVVMQSAVEDSCGRLVSAHLTPLLLDVSRRLNRGDLEAVLRHLVQMAPAGVDPSYAAWLTESLRDHERFWATRIAREQAIGRATAVAETAVFQPALFDRRAERGAAERADLVRELASETQARLAAAERAAAVHPGSPSPVLLLMA